MIAQENETVINACMHRICILIPCRLDSISKEKKTVAVVATANLCSVAPLLLWFCHFPHYHDCDIRADAVPGRWIVAKCHSLRRKPLLSTSVQQRCEWVSELIHDQAHSNSNSNWVQCVCVLRNKKMWQTQAAQSSFFFLLLQSLLPFWLLLLLLIYTHHHHRHHCWHSSSLVCPFVCLCLCVCLIAPLLFANFTVIYYLFSICIICTCTLAAAAKPGSYSFLFFGSFFSSASRGFPPFSDCRCTSLSPNVSANLNK